MRMLKVDGCRLCARIGPIGSFVEELAILGPDLEAVAGKGESMSNNIVDSLAVLFRRCRRPRPLQFTVGFFGRLRECGSEPHSENQPAHRPNDPAHDPTPVVMRNSFRHAMQPLTFSKSTGRAATDCVNACTGPSIRAPRSCCDLAIRQRVV